MTMKTEAPAPGMTAAGAGEGAHLAKATHSDHTTHAQLVEAAVALADLGYVPIPLSANGKPMLRWKEAEATPDQARLRFESRPNAWGLAVVALHAVLDLDVGHAEGVSGIATFEALAEGRAIPPCPCVRTKRGGVHLWFRRPWGDLRTRPGALGPGIDLKAGIALATAPPTPGYSWIAPPVAYGDLPEMPPWLAQLAVKPLPSHKPAAPVRPWRGDLHPWARAALNRELSAVAAAPKGQRNAALFRAALKLGALAAGGALPADAVAQGLLVAAEACGVIRDDGQATALATIASGLRAGLQRPRALPEGGRRDG